MIESRNYVGFDFYIKISPLLYTLGAKAPPMKKYEDIFLIILISNIASCHTFDESIHQQLATYPYPAKIIAYFPLKGSKGCKGCKGCTLSSSLSSALHVNTRRKMQHSFISLAVFNQLELEFAICCW